MKTKAVRITMLMTANDALNKGTAALIDAGIDNAASEARWIFESAVTDGRKLLMFHPGDKINPGKFFEKISDRAAGNPIQYVIGEWDFYGETFSVGQGVLIPRPETEMLVDFALGFLKGKNGATVVDLCAGSGCIGLTVAKLVPSAKVILVEKSTDAIRYLKKNLERLDCKNAVAVSGDAFKLPEENGIGDFDLLLSNPLYIESSEIPFLQFEVQREPVLALDGGTDGLDFYRVISEKWLPHCKGAVCVECGENQSEEIEKLFHPYCKECFSQTDFNNIKRTVCGIK